MNAGVRAPAQVEPVRLNLGAGEAPLAGYRNLDGKNGDTIYPLDHADGSVDEIRASHILEHFSHREIAAVIKDWTRALKWDGVLKIAVPDFETIAKGYMAGERGQWQGYVMGGHVDDADRHGAIFDSESLTALMQQAGLRDIEPWRSEIEDCASLPVSLNLAGKKTMKVAAVMSVPRLGFMDNFFSAFQALIPLGIPLSRGTGAFWGQCLERTMTDALATGVDAVLTLDYDTIFTAANVQALIGLARSMPDVGAFAALQQARSTQFPLMTITGEDGKNITTVTRETLDADTIKVSTAHFGCTLIMAAALRAVPKPWFVGVPDPSGGWGEGRIDDDIYFWKQFEKAGQAAHVANRVVVGHLELMIRWPNINLEPTYQHPNDFFEKGIPEGTWE